LRTKGHEVKLHTERREEERRGEEKKVVLHIRSSLPGNKVNNMATALGSTCALAGGMQCEVLNLS
jgi:hypothetical protein